MTIIYSMNFRVAASGRPRMWLALLLTVGVATALAGVRRAGAAGPEVSASSARPMPIGDGAAHMTSAQCLSCHATDAPLSHPVGRAPTMKLPAAFPLEAGAVNCTTCHLDTFAAHAAADHALLRGAASGGAFCAQCHTQTALGRPNQHPTVLGQAHLTWPGRGTSTDTSANPRDDGVISCLACHDGTVAPDAYGGLMSDGSAPPAVGKSHAVGVSYPVSTLRRGAAIFQRTASIDRRVRLPGGQVTCNSCHSLYSTLPGLLVMKNDNSALCVACHAQ